MVHADPGIGPPPSTADPEPVRSAAPEVEPAVPTRPETPEPVDDAEATAEPPAVPLRTLFARFWPDTRGLRGWIAVGFALTAASALAAAVDVWLYKVLVDDVLAPRRFGAFPLLAAIYLGIAATGGGIGFLGRYLAARIGELFVFRLRNRVFDHAQTLSVHFFDRRRLGDTLSRLTSDVQAIEELVCSGVVTTFATVFELALLTAVLLHLNWRLALICFALAPVFLALSGRFTRRIREASRHSRARDGALTSVAEETFANVTFVQAYGRQAHQRARFVEQARAAMVASVRAAKVSALFTPLVDLLQAVGVIVILGVGVWQLSAGRITLGGLLVFLVYLAELYGPVNGLSELAGTAFTAAAAGERILELLDQPSAPGRTAGSPSTADATPSTPAAAAAVGVDGTGRVADPPGHLQLSSVSYRYPHSGRDALHELTLELAPGTVTAVVGASGSGKSTLVGLLLRLDDPTRGTIRLDGQDLRTLEPDRLRRGIAVVLQETLLMDGTIAENILAGHPGATAHQLYAAARAARAHEFIVALPQGYNTRIGQRGRLLSGGQRQRLAIARALIRDAPVLLLDEPDTGIDGPVAEDILAALRRLPTPRTTLIISHNPATAATADRIVVLEHGRLTAVGTHRHLMDTHPGYRQLQAAATEQVPTTERELAG